MVWRCFRENDSFFNRTTRRRFVLNVVSSGAGVSCPTSYSGLAPGFKSRVRGARARQGKQWHIKDFATGDIRGQGSPPRDPSWWGHHQKIAIFEAKIDSKFKFSALARDFSAFFNENRVF